MSVKTEVEAFILDEIAVGRGTSIDQEEDLLASGTIDSFGVTQLVAFLEDRYGIHVSDEELKPLNFQSLARIEAFVARRRPGARTW
jgi:acyl carrier protein